MIDKTRMAIALFVEHGVQGYDYVILRWDASPPETWQRTEYFVDPEPMRDTILRLGMPDEIEAWDVVDTYDLPSDNLPPLPGCDSCRGRGYRRRKGRVVTCRACNGTGNQDGYLDTEDA